MMKQFLLFCCCFLFLCALTNPANAQKTEAFGTITYTLPKGWQKKDNASAVMLGAEGPKGTCVVTVFKALPGTDDAKANFKASWETIAKGVLKTVDAPKMQPTAKEDGWIAESGAASYESDGKKGLAVLVTLTGDKKMVNIFILTDTDAYQSDIAAFLESVHLPKLTATAAPSTPSSTPQAARPSKYQFTTSNFDDGWTAVEQADWVRVTKGNVAALIHYPNPKTDAYNSVLKAGLQNAWNLLVAPRYTNIRNFDLKPIQSFESIDFVEADAEDKATRKTVHIVLLKKHFYNSSGKYIEFVTNSKADFEREFGPYHNTEFGWDKCVAMQAKNKFAVAKSDLTGKWSTSGTSSLSYYYVNGGGYAGATATSTADLFTFAPSGTYVSDHAGASGVVGNQKFSRQVYKGSVSVDRWSMTLTNRFKGETEKYDGAFEAVKGGRILRLTDKRNYVYALVKQ